MKLAIQAGLIALVLTASSSSARAQATRGTFTVSAMVTDVCSTGIESLSPTLAAVRAGRSSRSAAAAITADRTIHVDDPAGGRRLLGWTDRMARST